MGYKVCSKCNGDGVDPDNDQAPCPQCDGDGEVRTEEGE